MVYTPYEDRALAVSVADVKTFLRVTHTNDDTIIESFIRAAMAFVENYCDATFTEDCDYSNISDFFNDEDLASKWTIAGTVSETDYPGALVVTSSAVALSGMAGAAQHLEGNFDVRAFFKIPVAFGENSGVGLVAYINDDNGIGAYYSRAAAAQRLLRRLDTFETAESESTVNHATVTEFYIRLQRIGGRFYAYGKTNNTDPWILMAPPAVEKVHNGAVDLWITCYHGATAFESWALWFVDDSEWTSPVGASGWPLQWCYEGSGSGSRELLWGECAEINTLTGESPPECCIPLWKHPCRGEITTIPYPVLSAIMHLVRRTYDNRGGVNMENAAGWAITWADLENSDAARLLEPYRNVGV